MNELFTTKQLAAYLKMSVRQIYNMTMKRKRAQETDPLPMMKVNGNLRFSKNAVDAWLLRQQEGRAA
jgi:predicted DNA-binding transcriptional regulator AlpA